MTEHANAKEFYDLAQEYCSFVSEYFINQDTAPDLMEILMKLYVAALHLPDADPDTAEPSADDPEPLSIDLGDDVPQYYWEVPDPFVLEEPVCGDLAEDLAEIGKDLGRGMAEYEEDRIGDALFEWKFLFDSHWGQHAADALRALHSARCVDHTEEEAPDPLAK